MLIKNQFVNILQTDIHCKLYLPDHFSEDDCWLVMLHQGLGSIPQWKTVPEKLFKALNMPILLYERIGYGETGTTLNPLPENFLFTEAFDVLPKLLTEFNIKNYYLFGHSDGATISLLYASTQPQGLKGITALTPHVFVEEITKQGIEKLIQDYDKGILSYFLEKYQKEKTEQLFRRWTGFWLSEPLVSWNMFDELKKVKVPVLLIQGTNDEFGSFKQLEWIEQLCSVKTEKIVIDNCRHNPHLEYTELVILETKKAVLQCKTALQKD